MIHLAVHERDQRTRGDSRDKKAPEAPQSLSLEGIVSGSVRKKGSRQMLGLIASRSCTVPCMPCESHQRGVAVTIGNGESISTTVVFFTLQSPEFDVSLLKSI